MPTTADRTEDPAEPAETLSAERFADVAESLGDAVGEVLDQFHELGQDNAAEIERASGAADHAGVRSAAHQLKGMSMTLGAHRLRDLCAQIELAAGAGSRIGPGVVAALRQEVTAAHAAMVAAAPADASGG